MLVLEMLIRTIPQCEAIRAQVGGSSVLGPLPTPQATVACPSLLANGRLRRGKRGHNPPLTYPATAESKTGQNHNSDLDSDLEGCFAVLFGGARENTPRLSPSSTKSREEMGAAAFRCLLGGRAALNPAGGCKITSADFNTRTNRNGILYGRQHRNQRPLQRP